jgi:ribonuclease VapC
VSVVDSSALVAVLLAETGWQALQDLLEGPDSWSLCAANLVEASMVVEARLGPAGQAQLVALLDRARIEIRPVDERLAQTAINGWRRFGKGRHPAALNYGDCFSYALAIELDEPLLFVGDDFSQTDVEPALTG